MRGHPFRCILPGWSADISWENPLTQNFGQTGILRLSIMSVTLWIRKHFIDSQIGCGAPAFVMSWQNSRWLNVYRLRFFGICPCSSYLKQDFFLSILSDRSCSAICSIRHVLNEIPFLTFQTGPSASALASIWWWTSCCQHEWCEMNTATWVMRDERFNLMIFFLLPQHIWTSCCLFFLLPTSCWTSCCQFDDELLVASAYLPRAATKRGDTWAKAQQDEIFFAHIYFWHCKKLHLDFCPKRKLFWQQAFLTGFLDKRCTTHDSPNW